MVPVPWVPPDHRGRLGHLGHRGRRVYPDHRERRVLRDPWADLFSVDPPAAAGRLLAAALHEAAARVLVPAPVLAVPVLVLAPVSVVVPH